VCFAVNLIASFRLGARSKTTDVCIYRLNPPIPKLAVWVTMRQGIDARSWLDPWKGQPVGGATLMPPFTLKVSIATLGVPGSGLVYAIKTSKNPKATEIP
jgi:hypothetical protein